MQPPKRGQIPPRDNGKLTGVAKQWYDDKGFGFIRPSDGSEDVFCHRTNIDDAECLVVGRSLSYTKGWDDCKNKEFATRVTVDPWSLNHAGGTGQERNSHHTRVINCRNTHPRTPESLCLDEPHSQDEYAYSGRTPHEAPYPDEPISQEDEHAYSGRTPSGTPHGPYGTPYSGSLSQDGSLSEDEVAHPLREPDPPKG